MRPAIATPESVAKVADEILAAGQDLTADAVRERLGGGSFTTINKFLRNYRESMEKAQATKSKLSDGVARVIHEAVARAATIQEAESNARVDAVSRAASEAQQKLKRELDEAVHEIGKLESALEVAESTKTKALRAQADAEHRETEAQGRLREMVGRIESLTALLESVKSDAKDELAREREQVRESAERARAAIEEAAELRGQLKALKQET